MVVSEFQFLDFIITKIEYKATSLDDETENSLEFAYSIELNDGIHTLSVLTQLYNKQIDHSLSILLETKGKFMFSKSCEMSNSDKEQTIKTNGSAIIFPYIRSLICNLTSADTHGKPVILPTINFNNIIQEIDG